MLTIKEPIDTIYSHKQYEIGTRMIAYADGTNHIANEYVFLPGTTSVAQYDFCFMGTTGTGLSLGSVTRLVRAYAGPVCIAQAAITGPYYGWFLVKGVGWGNVGGACSAGSALFSTGTAAGVMTIASACSGIHRAIAIGTGAASGGTVKVLLDYPSIYGQAV